MSDDTFTGADFSAAADSSAATAEPVAPSTDTAQPEAPTTAAAVPAESSSPEHVRTGPIPFDVHKTALDNARTKAREEAQAEWRQQYGWAEQINRQEVEDFARLASQYKTEPIAYVQHLLTELQADPTYGPQLRSLAARTLGARQGQQTGQLPVIQLEDGSSVDLNALKAQWTEELDRKYAPALSAAEKLEKAEAQHAADTFAADFLKDVRTLPNFTAVEPQIKADLAAMIRTGKLGDHPAELQNAVRTLYLKHALPQLQTTERRAVLHDIHQQAAASTVNPARTSAAAPKSVADMTTAEALQHVAEGGAL